MKLLRAICVGFITCSILTACGPRGAITIAPNDSVGTKHQVYVATTRQQDANSSFSGLRTSRLSYAKYNISVPPNHIEGQIEWPKGTPDPENDFVTTQVTPYTSATDFRNALPRPRSDTAVIYVHGFNTTFAEGLYRMAQITHDIGGQDTTVHYSWPATQNTLEYTRDRDSVLFARDGLESLLITLSDRGFKRIVILAHSIGSNLVVETLRQISLQGRQDVLKRVNGVVLISPDIDTNLFETQISRIKPLPKPFVVFGDEADLALKVSSLLTGRASRLGQLNHTESLRRYGVEFVDVTDVRDGDGPLNHAVALTSPTVLSILRTLPSDTRIAAKRGVQKLQNLIDDATRP
jgi:esterase/lipase superfamily enzyme